MNFRNITSASFVWTYEYSEDDFDGGVFVDDEDHDGDGLNDGRADTEYYAPPGGALSQHNEALERFRLPGQPSAV